MSEREVEIDLHITATISEPDQPAEAEPGQPAEPTLPAWGGMEPEDGGFPRLPIGF